MIIAGEFASPTCNLLCDYLHTQFDPAHLLSELGFSLVFELLQILLVAYLWRRVIKPRLVAQVHDEIDSEHGYDHEESE